MNDITKEELIECKELLYRIFNNKVGESKLNIKNEFTTNAQNNCEKAAMLGLTGVMVNDSDIAKLLFILANVISYEELRYLYMNIKSIIKYNQNMKLLYNEQYEKLISKLNENDINEIRASK